MEKGISKNVPQILMPLKCDTEKTENNGGKPSLWYKVKKTNYVHTKLTLSISTTEESLLSLFLVLRCCQQS